MMRVRRILEEYELEIDDVRWYLACREAERLVGDRDDVAGLTALIESGRLEADWYRMEDRFLDVLEEKLSSRIVDEPEIRKLCNEIEVARMKRWTR